LGWEILGFVLASGYRRKVLLALIEEPKTPKQIARHTGLRINHVSLTLKELRERGLVECMTPELVKGRVYVLTEYGKKLASQLAHVAES